MSIENFVFALIIQWILFINKYIVEYLKDEGVT
jgi:hypothetical protein